MFKTICLAFGVAIAATTVQATTVTLDLQSGYVGPDAPSTHRVDLSAYLTNNRIVNAVVGFVLTDDVDPVETTTSYWSAYRILSLTGNSSFSERTREVYSEAERETAVLSVNGATRRTVSSSGVERTITNRPAYSCTTDSSGFQRCQRSVEGLRTLTHTMNGYMQASIFGQELQDLNANGYFDYSVSATAGDFNISNGVVQFTLEALPPSPVPLPAGAVLLLSALGAGTVVARRGRSRAAV